MMFARLVLALRRRFSWRGEDGVGVTATVEVGSPEPPVDSLEKETAGEGAANEIRRRLAEGVEALRSSAGSQGNDDVDGILTSLLAPGDTVVRQPPLAAQAVISVCRRRDHSIPELTSLIERDPALCQELLRHANSAWYGRRVSGPATSIRAAIQRVGTAGVHGAVMRRLVQGELSRPGPGLDQTARLVWEHMVRTAPVAQSLACVFGVEAEEAHFLGLLHDVGKLIFFDQVADLRKRERRDVKLPEGFIPSALRLLHEPLGGLAALEWGMDARLAGAIATHHRPGRDEAWEALAGVVRVAEWVDLNRDGEQAPDLGAFFAAEGIPVDPGAAREALVELPSVEPTWRRSRRVAGGGRLTTC